MSPTTTLEKLKESRNTLKLNVGTMEANLKKHAVTPLTLPKVRKYLERLEAINEKIAVNYERI